MSTAYRIEPPSPVIEHDCARCYVDAVADHLAATLRDVGPNLAMPRFVNPDRALRVLDHFIETMTGFALGVVADHLTAGMRRWFGAEGVGVMRGALHDWPRHEPVETSGTPVERLHVRWSLASAQVRALVEALPTRPRIDLMLGALAKDDVIRDRVAHELAVGWRVYTAAVTTRRYPPLTRLWQAWVWQLDGKPVLTRDETEQAGYITLVR